MSELMGALLEMLEGGDIVGGCIVGPQRPVLSICISSSLQM